MKSLVWYEVVFFSNLKKSHKITVDYDKNQIGYLLELEDTGLIIKKIGIIY